MQKETLRALRKLPELRVIALDIISHPNADQAAFAVSILQREECSFLFTINEWGIDSFGVLNEYIENSNCAHINWCVDDPFYEEIMIRKKFRSSPKRFDFVSDRDYLVKMRERGYQVEFMPLATDPQLFYPVNNVMEKEVVFVGNSYIAQVDTFVKSVNDTVKIALPFIASLLMRYRNDCMAVNVGEEIERYLKSIRIPQTVPFDKLVFICKQVTGYLYRKDLIVHCAETFKDFHIYGDAGWETIVSQKSIQKVWYGEELRNLYNSVKINLDCNRAVIRDGFTQRTFDVLACKQFLITGAKPLVEEMFEINGPLKEIITFKCQSELFELIQYYLNHEKERSEIATRGYNRVLQEHTYDHRIRKIFSIVT